jgi:hypothetical protein
MPGRARSLSSPSQTDLAFLDSEERLGGHQPSESLHEEIILVLDLIPDDSIPIGGTKHIDCGNAHGL